LQPGVIRTPYFCSGTRESKLLNMPALDKPEPGSFCSIELDGRMSDRSPIPKSHPLILLIPGLDGTGRFYDSHLAALSAAYRPLPWAFRQRSDFDFPDLVQDLGKATADEPPGSLTVVGESFGGTVALHFVLAYPERVRRLALINSFSFYQRRIGIVLGCRLSPMLRWYGIRNLKNYLSGRLLAAEGIPAAARRHYRKVVALIDPVAYRRRLELVRDVDLRGRLAEISVPTLIFAAGRDKIIPSVSSAAFMAARIPTARVYEFPDAGHALLLTPGFSLADYL
jgi:pimeloyl-ACP methyl ester carboxylesterase